MPWMRPFTLGNIERNNEHIERGGPGATCRAVGRNLSAHKDEMISLLKRRIF